MKANQDFFTQVAEKLIAQLERGTAPWQRPWDSGLYNSMPMNPTTGKRYRGGNAVFLAAQDRGDPRWMTYRQAEQAHAQVRKGEHGTPIVYWKFNEEVPALDEHGKKRLDEHGKAIKTTVELERPRAFLSFVFNAEQIDGLEALPKPEYAWEPATKAEDLLVASGAHIEHKAQAHAYYNPRKDSITLPEREQFRTAEGYYATALHELGHWTGHESRLDRDLAHPFGSEKYAREELRAEIGSMMLCMEIGIGHELAEHASYVQSWIKALREDPKEIFRAAADAEKILDYVMGLEMRQEQEQLTVQQHEDMRKLVHEQRVAPPTPQKEDYKRIYLEVPFSEKEEAKGLGARWDRQKRLWYAPAGSNDTEFLKWMPQSESAMAAEVSKIAVPTASPLISQNTTEHRTDASQAERSYIDTSRKYLVVPYIERINAKRAGAVWDAVAKSWYAGPRADMTKLEKWLPERASGEQLPAMTPREEFTEILRSMQCKIGGEHPIMDGQTHRIAVEGDGTNTSSGFYVAHVDGRPAGYAKNNRTGEELRWKSSGQLQSSQNSHDLQKQYAERREIRTVEHLKRQELASLRVLQQLGDMRPDEDTPYLQAKGVKAHKGIYTSEYGVTALPAQDAEGKIWTMQYINEDGSKRFAKDGRKTGCFHPVGGMDAVLAAPAFLICEGYATAASVAEAVGFATIAAFDAGNIEHVAKGLHEKYPDRPIVIAGDDDYHLITKTGTNPGREKAEKAAQVVGAELVFPIFAPQDREKAPAAHTDFNDLARSTLGQEAVKRQLAPIIAKAISRNEALRQEHQQTQTTGLGR